MCWTPPRRGFRYGDNPACWRGHLPLLIPGNRSHHAALPYEEAPAFLARLRAARGMGARALEFLPFTLGRESEVLGAAWPEIDLKAALWTVSAARMKAGREHRVPLCRSALTVLATMAEEVGREGLVFPGRSGRPLSNAV